MTGGTVASWRGGRVWQMPCPQNLKSSFRVFCIPEDFRIVYDLMIRTTTTMMLMIMLMNDCDDDGHDDAGDDDNDDAFFNFRLLFKMF